MFDQERYDELVAKGFSKVAAAFVCGANSSTEQTGPSEYTIHVVVPK